ncbi:MAG: hypothetical protein ACJAQT_004586 [Akkermansiaceae bacterium]|jgi:hypothetical protein
MKIILLALTLTLPAHAQAPGVSIFEQSRNGLRSEKQTIGKEAEALLKNGKLIDFKATEKLIKNPSPQALDLPAPKTDKLTPTHIAKLAKESSYRVGWAYLCKNCEHWHVNLAGGYAVTSDGVLATCAHVIDMGDINIREGGLIAVDHTGKVFPVTAILANDEKIDGALIKIDAKTTPLPLNDQVAPGNAAYCLSRPLDQGDYFSEGIVNRFFWNSSERGDDPNSLKAMGALKLNVSSRWAPGSSGSAVLDTCGNAIGHVALIDTMGKDGSKKNGKTQEKLITLHTATPARAVIALTKETR